VHYYDECDIDFDRHKLWREVEICGSQPNSPDQRDGVVRRGDIRATSATIPTCCTTVSPNRPSRRKKSQRGHLRVLEQNPTCRTMARSPSATKSCGPATSPCIPPVAGSPAIVSCAGVANSCSVHGPRPPSINATPLRPRVPLLHSTTTTWFHFRFLLFSTSGIISPFSSFHSSVQAAPSLLFLNSAAVYTCLLLVWMRSCSLI
jgi:hypothetical protein